MKYSAINIGPILKTFGLARKPREMWAASYLFSYLMKGIINVIPNKKDVIISPAIMDETEHLGIGLYPDRLFVKGEIKYEAIKPAIEKFAKTLDLDASYFNVMLTSGDYSKDSEAIKDLNHKLNNMELFNMTSPQTATEKVRELIMKPYGSPLFVDALGDKRLPVETLEEIAEASLKEPKDKLKSYHKYICVVQADGDNMGATVTHSQLPEGMVNKISTELLEFGKNATKTIRDFGGLPIYAGGDDLLFIAPVVGKNDKNILWLLDQLNKESFKGVKELVKGLKLKFEDGDNKGQPIHPSLSFGVSVSYYKYPLYEAHEAAHGLLFGKAKHDIKGKNAIALDLRKHSGGMFGIEMSCNNSELKAAFDRMITASAADESIVSAVAHKIRENEGVLKLWEAETDEKKVMMRNGNFFRKYIEHDPDKEEDKNASDRYKDAALDLLNNLYILPGMTADKLTRTAYGMLRVAKFINGEEVRDE